MRSALLFLFASAFLLELARADVPRPVFEFNGTEYFHRWSRNGQHEFTPEGQTDLKKWTEMMTIILYPSVQDSAGLAQVAERVRNLYGENGHVLRTKSLPASLGRTGEHLIVVYFKQPTFVEVGFARFTLHDGGGASLVYGHRIYGEEVDQEMADWLEANGEQIEEALMAWNEAPSPSELELQEGLGSTLSSRIKGARLPAVVRAASRVRLARMKKVVSTTEAPAAVGPYSQAIRVGPMLFTAGQIPLDPKSGNIVSEDVTEQTRQVLNNLTAVLKAEGMDFRNIVKTTVFMTNLGDFAKMNDVYASYFEETPPARSTVQVSALPKGAQVEIEVVAFAMKEGGKSIDTWE